MNNKGDATEIWFVGENDGQLPNRYPAGWNVKSLTYNDKTPIEPYVMIEELNNTQEPNNWNISLDAIRREDKGKFFTMGAPLVSPLVSSLVSSSSSSPLVLSSKSSTKSSSSVFSVSNFKNLPPFNLDKKKKLVLSIGGAKINAMALILGINITGRNLGWISDTLFNNSPLIYRYAKTGILTEVSELARQAALKPIMYPTILGSKMLIKKK